MCNAPVKTYSPTAGDKNPTDLSIRTIATFQARKNRGRNFRVKETIQSSKRNTFRDNQTGI